MAFMAPVVLGAAVVGSALSAFGAIQAGNAAAAAANFNAAGMRQDAGRVENESAIEAGEIARRTRQTLAAGRAGAAANGLELSGSISDILDQTERQGNLDALTAVYEGKVKGNALRSGASLTQFEGAAARRNSRTQALGSLFSGTASVYSMGRSFGYWGG